MAENTWWASYDPETFKYTGMRLAVEQPENATNIGIGDLINPVWDPSANKWTGDSMDDELKKMAEQAEADENAGNKQISQIVQTVASYKKTTDASIAELMVQMASLQAQVSKTPTVSSTTTTNDSATIIAQ